MTRIRNALVIGGGIAGPSTALALRKAGVEAVVYEAYPDVTEGIGGSLTLASNGLAALDLVGLRREVEAAGLPIVGTAMSFGTKKVAIPQLEGVAPGVQILRNDLHRILHDGVRAEGIRVEYGKRLVGAEQDADGITATFADGTTARADVLVGADGVHSAVRTLIDSHAPGPEYTGILGFEAVVGHPIPGPPGVQHFSFGKRAYYLYWREADGSTRVGFNLPHPEPLRLTEARAASSAQWLRVLQETYGDDTPGGDLVRAVDPDTMHVTGSIYIMPSVPHWHSGRMVLVGDAVHAPSNSSGQGASLSIESGLELARCLRDLPGPAEAFTAYERMRRPRVEKIAAQAKRVNQVKSPGPLVRAVMPLLMRTFMNVAMNPEKTFGPTLRYRVDWDSEVASPVSVG